MVNAIQKDNALREKLKDATKSDKGNDSDSSGDSTNSANSRKKKKKTTKKNKEKKDKDKHQKSDKRRKEDEELINKVLSQNSESQEQNSGTVTDSDDDDDSRCENNPGFAQFQFTQIAPNDDDSSTQSLSSNQPDTDTVDQPKKPRRVNLAQHQWTVVRAKNKKGKIVNNPMQSLHHGYTTTMCNNVGMYRSFTVGPVETATENSFAVLCEE